MSISTYDFHGITVRIDTSSDKVPWLIQNLDYFKLPSVRQGPVNIDIVLGDFSIDTADFFNIDHKFYAKKDELYFRSTWSGSPIKCYFKGIEGNSISVKLSLSPKGLLFFPWLLHAEWIIYLCVLKPLLSLLWARQDKFLIHTAAVSKDGEALLFGGYGSSYKTTFAMKLLHDGWRLLGDDYVLLSNEGVSSFPYGCRTLDFRVNHQSDETMTIIRGMRLALHLLSKKPITIPIEEHATVKGVNIVFRKMNANSGRSPLAPEQAVHYLHTNCMTEAICSYKGNITGSIPLQVYKMMFPDFDYGTYWDNLKSILHSQIDHVPIHKIEISNIWNESMMDLVT